MYTYYRNKLTVNLPTPVYDAKLFGLKSLS